MVHGKALICLRTPHKKIEPPDVGCYDWIVSMWQTYKFGMHWKHGGKMYYDEVPATSMVEATDYFIDNKRDDVTLVRVEEVGPDDDSAVREPSNSPVKPFSPLVAWRRMDKDEDAR